ncbi:hypothetical protein ABDK09_04445 [Vibrio sp. CDRSL-10 TSBA]
MVVKKNALPLDEDRKKSVIFQCHVGEMGLKSKRFGKYCPEYVANGVGCGFKRRTVNGTQNVQEKLKMPRWWTRHCE